MEALATWTGPVHSHLAQEPQYLHPDAWACTYTDKLNSLDAQDVTDEVWEVSGLIVKLTAANRADLVGKVVTGVLSAYAARLADRELGVSTTAGMDTQQAAALAMLGVEL